MKSFQLVDHNSSIVYNFYKHETIKVTVSQFTLFLNQQSPHEIILKPNVDKICIVIIIYHKHV